MAGVDLYKAMQGEPSVGFPKATRSRVELKGHGVAYPQAVGEVGGGLGYYALSGQGRGQFWLRYVIFRRTRFLFTDVQILRTIIKRYQTTMFHKGLTVTRTPDTYTNERTPDRSQLVKAQKFMRNSNLFDAPLATTMRVAYAHYLIYGEAYVLLEKAYKRDEDGNLKSELKNVRALDPTFVTIPLDDRRRPKTMVGVCLFHREHVVDIQGKDPRKLRCEVEDEEGNACEDRIYPGTYWYSEWFATAAAGGVTETGTGSQHKDPDLMKGRVYVSDEMCKITMCPTDYLTDFPLIYTLRDEIDTLRGIRRIFYNNVNRKPAPSSFVHFPLNNTDAVMSIQDEWDDLLDKRPEAIPMISTPEVNRQGAATGPQVMQIKSQLSEAPYLDIKRDAIERISAAYGITPAFVNTQVPAGGTLTSDTQMKITHGVVEHDREMLNDILYKIAYELGLRDYQFWIADPDEKADTIKMSILTQATAAVTQLTAQGWDCRLPSEGGRYSLTSWADAITVSGGPELARAQYAMTIANLSMALQQVEMMQKQMDMQEDQAQAAQLQQLAGDASDVLGKAARSSYPTRELSQLMKATHDRISKAVLGMRGNSMALRKAQHHFEGVELDKSDGSGAYGGMTGGVTPDHDVKPPELQGQTSKAAKKPTARVPKAVKPATPKVKAPKIKTPKIGGA